VGNCRKNVWKNLLTNMQKWIGFKRKSTRNHGFWSFQPNFLLSPVDFPLNLRECQKVDTFRNIYWNIP
jgi:hypothetical protein